MRLGFSNILETLVEKHPTNYPDKGTVQSKISKGLHEGLFDDAYVLNNFFLIFFTNAYAVVLI